MSKVSVQPFGSADLDPVLAIWNRVLPRDPINAARFVAWLFGDADYWPGADSGFFVASRAGQPVGFLRAIVRRWPNDRVGLEPEHGWIPILAVDAAAQREGVGTLLVDAALGFFRAHGRRTIWVCGNSGSAPGYVFPGVDTDTYARALSLLTKRGFVLDHDAVAMSRGTIDFDLAHFQAEAWKSGKDVELETLTPTRVQDFLVFLAESFPGDWNMAARAKIRSGQLGEVLIATLGGKVVGYCQWEGEHFGPFGVTAHVRSQGIGAKLFVEAVRRIRAADGRSVWFNWADPNAARFYARFGLQATRHYAILRCDL